MPRRAELTISKRTVDGLSVEARDAVFWDRELPGFGARVYPSGRKIYVVQSRGPGGSKRITLGRHGELTVEQARKQAVAVIDRIKKGEDPVAAPPEPAFTVADLAERYMEAHVAVNCNAHTQGIYRGSLDNHILPALGKMPIPSMGRSEAAALHYELRNTPRAANRALMVLSKMFSLAEDWGLAPAGGNPCRFVRKYKEGMRERFLAEHEYRRIGCELCVLEAEGPLPARAAAALRLLMLTGCRLNEILSLRWDDVDRKAGDLRLRDAKTGARMVPLTPTAIDGSGRELTVFPRSSWVFAGVTPDRHLSQLSTYWRRVRARCRGGRRADPRFAAQLRQQGPGARRELDHDRAASRAHRCREHGALCAPGAGRREDRGGPGGRQHRGRHPARQGRRSGRWGSVSAD